jgi:hypothetical protein
VTPAAIEPGAPRPWRRIGAALLALLFLNGMLSFSTWWPTPGIVPDKRLAPEFVWLWLALLAAVGLRGRLSRVLASVFALLYLLLVLGRYADVTVPSLFGRPINLYWDIPQIPRFLWVSAQDLPGWGSAGVAAAVVLLFWGLFRLLRWAIEVTAREAVPYALRTRWVWGLSAAAVVLVSANLAGVRATWPVVSKPVIPTYWLQAQMLVAAFSEERLATWLPERSVVDAAVASPRALAGLNGRDLYLIFLESYGAVAYDDAAAARVLGPARRRFAEDIAAGGRRVVSAFLRSPTFAGGSDLAHLGLLSGIDLSDPMRHDLLLTTQRPLLTQLFREHGYQSFGLYPAVDWPWPERRFYGFDVYLQRADLNWRGPALGYWSIPDPFALARFEQLHPRDADAPPRLLFFPTITTHMPFSPVPPHQDDWQRLLSDRPYDEAEVQRAQAAQPNWLDMRSDFVAMIAYAYRWLGSWLQRPEPRDTLYVLIGDHQPAANITGEGASWDVPVHIVSRDAALLQRFVAQGFAPGVEPPRAPLGPMHQLTSLLLQAFAAEPAVAVPAPVDAPLRKIGLR